TTATTPDKGPDDHRSATAEKAHMTPNRSNTCPYQSPHGARSNGMLTDPPPSTMLSICPRASCGVSVVYSSEEAVSRVGHVSGSPMASAPAMSPPDVCGTADGTETGPG